MCSFESVEFSLSLRPVRFGGGCSRGDRFYLTDAPESLFPAGSDPLDCSELAAAGGFHWISVGDGSAGVAVDRVRRHCGSGSIVVR